MTARQYETEWQFAARDLQHVREYLRRHARIAGFKVVRCHSVDLTDQYLDTEDARLARAGYALRVRSCDATCEATLKGLQRRRTGPVCRREISQPLDLSRKEAHHAPPGPVTDRVRAVIGNEPLNTLFVARTHRDVYQVMNNNVEAAEIDLDTTEIQTDGTAAASHLQRVEVEVRNAEAEALEPLVRQLRDSTSLEPAAATKFELGLSAAGRALPAAPGHDAPHIAPDAAAAVAGRMLLHRQLGIWRFLEPSVRLADEPEALHELRVTGRRLLAILRLLDTIPVAGAGILRTRLQALLRRTSAARDLDVQIAEIGDVNRLTDGSTLQSVMNRLAGQRARQQQMLLRVLDSPRTASLFAALDELAAQPPRPEGRRSVTQVARQLIRRRYRKLHNAALRVAADPTADHCHAMRLETKKLRYIGELLESAYGNPMRRFLRRLQRLQSILGKINDAHHAMGCLEQQRRQSRRSLSPEALVAMGRMSRRHARRLARYLADLPKVWHRVSGRRWRRLRRSLRSIEREAQAEPAGRAKQAA